MAGDVMVREEFVRGLALPSRWAWRERSGNFVSPAQMATRHLFFTLRMIWNNRMPPHARVGSVRLYDFSEHYTPKYLAEAILAIGQELLGRTDMAPDWKRQFDRMKQYAQRQADTDTGLLAAVRP